jgi:hypothetical protein
MKLKNLFWGMFFLTAAAIIVLGQLGYLTNVNIWSLVITILLIPVIIKSSLHLNFWGILFPFAIIAIIFSEQLGLENLTPWTLLAAALFGSIGLSIIFSKHYEKHCHFSSIKNENFEEIINCPDEDIVNLSVSFGSSIKYVNSENFKKANLRCSFGALAVYFDNAKIDGDKAEIHLDVSFSGVEIYMPKNWKVVNNVNVSLGGIEEKNPRIDSNSPTVILTGNVSLAGVEIIYI